MAISRSRRPQESTTCAWRRRVASKGAQMAQPTYPAVYIDQFAPGPPIQGGATSTAPILAPPSEGPLGEPTKITSFDAYQAQFGDPRAGFYGWHGARGFFDNGGRVCYVLGVSNAARASVEPLDSSAGAGKPTLVV